MRGMVVGEGGRSSGVLLYAIMYAYNLFNNLLYSIIYVILFYFYCYINIYHSILTSKEPVCPRVELILKIIIILLIIFLGFIKSKPC